MIWDILRVLVLVLFGLTIGETAWIVRVYFRIVKNTRALLPMHVLGFGAVTLTLETEAVANHVHRFGQDLTWHLPYNLVVFSVLYASLVLVRVHVTRRVRDQATDEPST